MGEENEARKRMREILARCSTVGKIQNARRASLLYICVYISLFFLFSLNKMKYERKGEIENTCCFIHIFPPRLIKQMNHQTAESICSA